MMDIEQSAWTLETLLMVIIILFLLVLSAFFSGSETALTAASKASMHGLEKEGNKRAAVVNRLRERKDKMIGALLLGNNLVNILASALATVLFLDLVGESGVVWATLVMTLLVLIFSEVMPKTYALLYSTRMALVVAPIVKYLVLVFGPITAAVVWLVYKILNVFGIDTSHIADTSEEELRGAIELHEGQDIERWEQRAMLRSILDLAEVEVSEIMTHRKNMVMIDVDTPLDQIITEVLNCPFTRLPIWKDNQDNIIGVIHAKWLMRELQKMGNNYKELNLSEVASEAWFIPETTTLFDQLQAFKERKEHFAIVIDEYGALMGVVTLEDILEEIVGEIDDEHDVPVPGVTSMPNGAYVVEGTVAIRDLNREFEWNLSDEEDYSTVAGLILYESKMIPEVGQVFNFQGFRFKVTKRQRNQIVEVKVYPPEKKENG